MFFSVIVPTYNPHKCLRTLLDSISKNDCANDLEVILSDDCSEEPFNTIVFEYPDLDIKMICNEEHSGFPRNGRQHGSEVAAGKWLCFADQDDYFVDHGLDKIKSYIEENDIHNYLASNFISHFEGSKDYKVVEGTTGWTHGKFYEKEFWDRNEICFDDISYGEDTNLSTKVGCVMALEKDQADLFYEPIYVWNRTADSLSLSENYFKNGIQDYIKETFGVIVNYIEKAITEPGVVDELTIFYIRTLYHLYFYFQTSFLKEDRSDILKAALAFYPIHERFKNLTGHTTDYILENTNSNLRGLFAETRNNDYQQIPFVESMTFEQWVKAYLN